MGTPNIKESIWTKYKVIVEANKEKRKYSGGWSENEPPEIIYDDTCENDTDEDGKLIPYPWEYSNLLSWYWVIDLFGDDWRMVSNLLLVANPEIVFVNERLYYREEFIKNVLTILQNLAKSNFVNQLRPIPQLVKDIATPVYSSKDLMKILDVKESTLRHYRDDGLLDYSKVKDKIWYTQEHLNNFLNKTDIRHKKKTI